MALIHILVLVLFLSTINGENYDKDDLEKVAKVQGVDSDNLNAGQVYMVPPVMTEEEQGSHQMPKVYRCGGCMASAYQFQKGFSLAEKKLKKRPKLLYSDVLEITEDVCNNKLSGYGVKNVNDKKVLSGEGLRQDKEPGVMETGGRWEVRMKIICAELIELYEEDGIYDQYAKRRNKSLAQTLCSKHCSQEEMDELRNERDEL